MLTLNEHEVAMLRDLIDAALRHAGRGALRVAVHLETRITEAETVRRATPVLPPPEAPK